MKVIINLIYNMNTEIKHIIIGVLFMKIQDLIYYRYLADCSSFTKTAEKFYVSQPSISIALKRLEEEFGTQLITRDRSSRSFDLTATGKILYNRAGEIINLLETTRSDIDSLNSKTIELGFDPLIGSFYLPKLVPNLSDFMSQLNLVEESHLDKMIDLLRHHTISIAIVGSDTSQFLDKSIHHYLIDEKKFKLCVAKDHPLANQEQVSVEMMLEYSFVAFDHNYVQNNIFKQWAKNISLDISKVTFTKDIQTIRTFISSGATIGLMTDIVFQDDPNIVMIPIEKAPTLYISLLMNKQNNLSESQNEFNTVLYNQVTHN